MVISNTCIFLQISIYHRTAATRVSVVMVWVIPYKLFLKVPWVNKQLASSDFIFGTRKKATAKNEAQGHLDAFFLPPITENSRCDYFLADGQQKTSFVMTCLVF
jgi:hypothetical protein